MFKVSSDPMRTTITDQSMRVFPAPDSPPEMTKEQLVATLWVNAHRLNPQASFAKYQTAVNAVLDLLTP